MCTHTQIGICEHSRTWHKLFKFKNQTAWQYFYVCAKTIKLNPTSTISRWHTPLLCPNICSGCAYMVFSYLWSLVVGCGWHVAKRTTLDWLLSPPSCIPGPWEDLRRMCKTLLLAICLPFVSQQGIVLFKRTNCLGSLSLKPALKEWLPWVSPHSLQIRCLKICPGDVSLALISYILPLGECPTILRPGPYKWGQMICAYRPGHPRRWWGRGLPLRSGLASLYLPSSGGLFLKYHLEGMVVNGEGYAFSELG